MDTWFVKWIYKFNIRLHVNLGSGIASVGVVGVVVGVTLLRLTAPATRLVPTDDVL